MYEVIVLLSLSNSYISWICCIDVIICLIYEYWQTRFKYLIIFMTKDSNLRQQHFILFFAQLFHLINCFRSISTLELRHIMSNLGEKMKETEIDEMILHSDVDGDGLVDCNEWVTLMTQIWWVTDTDLASISNIFWDFQSFIPT